ncbi:MAG: threonine ammonia-lyase [Parvularculaceae bacterium]
MTVSETAPWPETADPPTAAGVAAAARRIAGAVVRTPLVRAERLSALTGLDLWLKLECLQHTGAFKERGALNKLLMLTDGERRRGVIAASAGNHAQGLAHHATRLGIPATIVMPTTTPDVKIRKTREFGAAVVLEGADFDAAHAAALARADADRLVYVHPFDDADVVCGQGTIALEMLEDRPDLDVIVAPVGGGGLISGVATAAKAVNPAIEIIGVEAALFPSMTNALDGGARPVGGGTLAEGVAVRDVGRLTRSIVARLVDDIVLVDERALERALSLLMNEQKLLVEGAGATGFAAALAEPERLRGKRVGLILCGGNIDQRLLSMILMRDLARSGRLARLRIELLDVPGSLVAVASIIAREDGNVIDVGHHRTYSDLPAKVTCMDVTVDTQGQEHLDRIVANLVGAGYPCAKI